LFAIRRDVPGATREDVDAAGFRAVACAYEYPGLRWVRSYWDEERGQLLCVYEARDAAQIENHSRRSRLACDEIRPVLELGPEAYVAPAGAVPNEWSQPAENEARGANGG